MTDPDDLVARLHAVPASAKPDNSAFHIYMRDAVAAAAEIERLRAELASGSFYKESDIDALQDEIERLRDLLGRYALYANNNVWTAITDDEAKEIVRYRNAARAKMEGEG